MKNTKLLLVVGLAFLAGVITSMAQIPVPTGGYSQWTVGGSTSYTWASKTNFMASPLWSKIGGSQTPVATYINATTDLAAGPFAWWQAIGTPLNEGLTNATTSLYLTATNGIVAMNPIVIVHAANGAITPNLEIRMLTAVGTLYQSNVVTSPFYPNTITTNYYYTATVSAAPTYNVLPGDYIIPYQQGGTIGTSTNVTMLTSGVNLNAGGAPVINSVPNAPVLVSIAGTTTFGVNLMSGTFVP